MRAAIVVQLALIVPVCGQHCYTIVSVCTHFNTATHGVELMLMLVLLPLSVPWVSRCGVVAADVVAAVSVPWVSWYGRSLVVNRCLFRWWHSLANEQGRFVMCADVTS